MSDSDAFPFPIPEYGAEPFWAACQQERLEMQQCSSCQRYRWQPAPLCTSCAADTYQWMPLSGRGRVTTWTEITHPVHPAAVARVPYIVVEVELEEQAGLRILSNLIDIEAAAVAIDMPVTVCFTRHPNGQNLPVFRALAGTES